MFELASLERASFDLLETAISLADRVTAHVQVTLWNA